ncbi:hypothetical protein COBT_003815, partial [Conglomerata obtusa]
MKFNTAIISIFLLVKTIYTTNESTNTFQSLFTKLNYIDISMDINKNPFLKAHNEFVNNVEQLELSLKPHYELSMNIYYFALTYENQMDNFSSKIMNIINLILENDKNELNLKIHAQFDYYDFSKSKISPLKHFKNFYMNFFTIFSQLEKPFYKIIDENVSLRGEKMYVKKTISHENGDLPLLDDLFQAQDHFKTIILDNCNNSEKEYIITNRLLQCIYYNKNYNKN